ncbi:hypothetical protein KY327_03660 [Candidatus Woesearchaeota archaeon]|nr:hypothetical protein [Candidatus Woesearchaeota archaeon]
MRNHPTGLANPKQYVSQPKTAEESDANHGLKYKAGISIYNILEQLEHFPKIIKPGKDRTGSHKELFYINQIIIDPKHLPEDMWRQDLKPEELEEHIQSHLFNPPKGYLKSNLTLEASGTILKHHFGQAMEEDTHMHVPFRALYKVTDHKTLNAMLSNEEKEVRYTNNNLISDTLLTIPLTGYARPGKH